MEGSTKPTNKETFGTRHLWHIGEPRVFVWPLLGIAVIFLAGMIGAQRVALDRQLQQAAVASAASGQFMAVLASLHTFDAALASAKTSGVDTTPLDSLRAEVVALLRDGQYVDAAHDVHALTNQLAALVDAKKVADQAAADAARPSAVDGTVKYGATALSQVLLELKTGDTVVTQATTDAAGHYHLEALAGTYTLTASKAGYVSKQQDNVVLAAGGSQMIDLSLSKSSSSSSSSSSSKSSSSSSSSTTSSSDSTDNSSYAHTVVSTSRGSITADIMTFDLGKGVTVKTATANDDDCPDDCPVSSLMGFVNANGAVSGINGTYFCPADYGASCEHETNAYFWKVFKSSASKLINGANGLGEFDPMIAFTSSGHAEYFPSWNAWKSSGFATYAGINSKPRLVEGGANVLSDGDMDDKQRTTKSNRGALGLKGQTLYCVIVRSATVPDLAAVMTALGVNSAMNIDGGGSSAMVYRGSYKVGPGRSIPNALVIVH